MVTEWAVAMTAGIVLLGAMLTFIMIAFRQHDVTFNRVAALDNSTVGFERMQRELRQALQLDPSPVSGAGVTTGVLRARVWVKTAGAPAQHWVRYDCSAGTSCTRRDETAGTVAQPLVDKVVAGTGALTFTVVPALAPAVIPSVRIGLSRQIDSATHPIRLDSTVTPRNCVDGYPTGSTTCTG